LKDNLEWDTPRQEAYPINYFVTGLILALTMPVGMPWHFVLVGAFVASFITKMAFGGLGRNKFNPALVGRCLVGVISSKVASDFYLVTINGESMISLSLGGTNTLARFNSCQYRFLWIEPTPFETIKY
jgi:electron transport complex protein RnfD